MRDLSKRGFLTTLLGASVAAAGCAGINMGGGQAKVGIQLYTVRDALDRDFEGTLAQLAQWGYQEVETHNLFGRTAAQAKAIFNANGLLVPSCHISRLVVRDNIDSALDDAATLGASQACLNWLAPDERVTLDQYRAWADLVNIAAEKAAQRNIKFNWHNHDFEFMPIDGKVPYELLIERLDARVGFELDLYWAAKGGVDIIGLLRRLGPRVRMAHVKDRNPSNGAMADVGQGDMQFAEIFRAHKFEHYFAERDDAPDQMASAHNSVTGMQTLLRGL